MEGSPTNPSQNDRPQKGDQTWREQGQGIVVFLHVFGLQYIVRGIPTRRFTVSVIVENRYGALDACLYVSSAQLKKTDLTGPSPTVHIAVDPRQISG